MKNVWITADLHLCHGKILSYQKNRIEGFGLSEDSSINEYNNKVIDMWLQTTKRGDEVYVLGDFILANKEITFKILNKLKSNGCKIHLIVGNHDRSAPKFPNMFESVSLIKNVIFKKSEFDFLDEDFNVVMCHYPMKSWPCKPLGSMMLYGHVHSNSPWIDYSDDLTMNVGIDNPLCDFKLFNLKDIYSFYKGKIKEMKPREYIDFVLKNNKFFIK